MGGGRTIGSYSISVYQSGWECGPEDSDSPEFEAWLLSE